MTPENQARWYAAKVVLTIFIVIGALTGLAYIDMFLTFIALAVFFIMIVSAAIFIEAYDRKLMELLKNDQ